MNVVSFMQQVSCALERQGSYGTAHVYRSTLNAIRVYHGSRKLSFAMVSPEWLKGFEIHLRSRGLTWNTVSTYMRTFRAVFNRAVSTGKVAYVPLLFHSVYTGTRADCKRALSEADMKRIFAKDDSANLTPAMCSVREMFILMFLLRGLPFVDLVYLRKSDLHQNTITYRRRKTGRPLSVTLTPAAMFLVKKHWNQDASSPYLFSWIKSKEGTKEAYREYQQALRFFNQQLMLLGAVLQLTDHVSSYTARHTWATTAYYCEIHPGIISAAMGHSSVMVTETYLKPFKNKKIDEANEAVISFVQNLSSDIMLCI